MGSGARRYRKINKDTINGISGYLHVFDAQLQTFESPRRLARRGGVKRISASIYNEMRMALKDRLTMILRDAILFTEHRQAKTVSVNDILFSLRRIGKPMYGFDPDTYTEPNRRRGPPPEQRGS
ncbi:related to histone H4 [Cephalotrichum gorgonifer]|uniref:Related to histone H4 n=1 Tax=Cephalotrichum gorgonifer TaxID=2041049 RepID=A0AAE8ST44_9PEZI|nr:related to histone H4 [Cephalotrichum gorgonifer]